MAIIGILLENLVNGVSTIQQILTADLSKYLGSLGTLLSSVGIDLTGVTLIGLLGGVGLIVLIIYSIIK